MSEYTFQKVAYSSVVGQSVMVLNRDGACVAQLSILVPSPNMDYRETADAVADQICKPDRKAALNFLSDEGQWMERLEAAVEAERERCAAVALNRWKSWTDQSGVSCDVTACEEISRAILADPDTTEKG